MRQWIRKPWFLPILLTLVILAGSELYTKTVMSKSDPLSKEEVKDQLGTMYGSRVLGVEERDGVFEVELSRKGAEYTATVDPDTGQVLELIQTKEVARADSGSQPQADETEKPKAEKPQEPEEPAKKPDAGATKPSEKPKDQAGTAKPEKPASKPAAQTSSKPAQKPSAPKKTVLISEKMAAQIAVSQLKTSAPYEVDDIDFVKTEGGGYYLVNIELDTDDDRDEVTYQIHAISGAVMSVEWDD